MALTDEDMDRLATLAAAPPAPVKESYASKVLADKRAEAHGIVEGLQGLVGTRLAMRKNARVTGFVQAVGTVPRPFAWVDGGRRYKANVPTPMLMIQTDRRVVLCLPNELLKLWIVLAPDGSEDG